MNGHGSRSSSRGLFAVGFRGARAGRLLAGCAALPRPSASRALIVVFLAFATFVSFAGAVDGAAATQPVRGADAEAEGKKSKPASPPALVKSEVDSRPIRHGGGEIRPDGTPSTKQEGLGLPRVAGALAVV